MPFLPNTYVHQKVENPCEGKGAETPFFQVFFLLVGTYVDRASTRLLLRDLLTLGKFLTLRITSTIS